MLRWFSWRRNGFRTAPGALLLRKGAIWRELVVVPLPRMQSVGLSQGPLLRRLRLAAVHLHTVQGPIIATIGALDQDDAMAFFEGAARDAVTSARADRTHRWAASSASRSRRGPDRRLLGSRRPCRSAPAPKFESDPSSGSAGAPPPNAGEQDLSPSPIDPGRTARRAAPVSPQQSGRLGVGMIGAGHVGPVLGAALAAAGHAIVGISAVSERSLDRAEAILPGVPVLTVPEIVERSELVLIAVPDDQLADLVQGLAATGVWQPGQLVVHTSAAHGLEVLRPALAAGAIPLAIHPALTFTGTTIDLVRLREAWCAVTAPGPCSRSGRRSSSRWAPSPCS